jgi:aprataxin
MSPKRKTGPTATSSQPTKRSLASTISSHFPGHDGLGAYLSHPETNPFTRVLYHTPSFVIINDAYPKSSVHTLLLPRSAKYNLLHPFDAFEDAEFLERVTEEAGKLKKLVATELRRKFGRFSAQDKAREAVLNGETELQEGESLPEGRDWETDVKVGVHAHPSMNHLHVHVISVDRYSECMKHRKHYNSFATEFFVPLEDFPLAVDDARRHERYLERDLVCWRCGRNFKNKFARLKEHLAEEFEVWKRE